MGSTIVNHNNFSKLTTRGYLSICKFYEQNIVSHNYLTEHEVLNTSIITSY